MNIKDYSKLFDLSGKTALVIGAGGGIGQAAAKGLAAHGAEVICADLFKDAADKTAESINSEGAKASSRQIDITKITEMQSIIDGLDRLDILVSTPAVNVRKPILDYTAEEFDKVINLNLKGNFFAMQSAGRRMAEQGGGSIILFASIRAMMVEPGQSVYAATKAGTLSIVRTLAAELGPKGVRANAIGPGVTETPLTAPIKDKPEWYNAYANRNALGRWARADELAGPVVYLASEAASYVTGTLTLVDGGWTAIDGRFTPPL